jgi:hypothetical protein
MAHSDDPNDGQWIDERLRTLQAGEFRTDVERARDLLRQRHVAAVKRKRRAWIAGASACLVVAALPWPRAVAQQFWDRVMLGRVAVVEVDRPDLPESLTAAFTMEPGPFEQEGVRDAVEAERLAGFRPSLPPAGVLTGDPQLSVVKTVKLSTRPLRIADIEQALAAANVSDVHVPKDWEGTILTAEAGPVVVASYDGVEIMQSAPFRMDMPSGFRFGHFMEIAFRVFGRSAVEAKALGEKFEANPALVMHFPERGSVRDVPLRSGRGIYVADVEGPEGICFFWNTSDRIYIVSAASMTEPQAAALANSMQ